MSTLAYAQVRRTLHRLRAVDEREHPLYRGRVSARETETWIEALSPRERATLAVDAPLAISSVRQAFHPLALTARPWLIVEFGASLGI